MVHQEPGVCSTAAGTAGADSGTGRGCIAPGASGNGWLNCRQLGSQSASGTSGYWPESMKVAVLGGGPSGAFAAEKLAAAGIRTVVFDEKLAWEKPCGGGLTWKAYSQYPFLTEGADTGEGGH